MPPSCLWSWEETISILKTVEKIECELGLGSYLHHRRDPEIMAYQWNSVLIGGIREILGRSRVEKSALCFARTARTTCTGYETVGLSWECLKVPLFELGYNPRMQFTSGCARALVVATGE